MLNALGRRLAVAVVLLTLGRTVEGHAGCVHDKKAIRLPSRSKQRGQSLRADHGSVTMDYAPLRIHFDWTHVENNGQSSEQQQYVKDIIQQSGAWLSSALSVRPEPGNLKFDPGSKPQV